MASAPVEPVMSSYGTGDTPSSSSDAGSSSGGARSTYSYLELMHDPRANKRPPAECDASRLESYLSDAEFKQVLGVDRAAFAKLPAWKVRKIKMEKKLF